MGEFLALYFEKSIVKRASITAVVVGAIMTVINHGDALLKGHLDGTRLLKIILTILVPYIVSTISSASTVLVMRKEQP
ncbi:MAG: nitrate/nitrite transporter NrtS [Chloroflexota bacterium]